MYPFKRFFAIVSATLVCVTACVFVRLIGVCKFSAIHGEHTFYLYSPSSQALQKQSLSLTDIPFLQGESVRLATNERLKWGETAQSLAKNIAQKYGATIFIEETAGELTSYYAYTPAWDTGVWLDRQRINLHIAVNGEVCAVGTPVIFGGF